MRKSRFAYVAIMALFCSLFGYTQVIQTGPVGPAIPQPACPPTLNWVPSGVTDRPNEGAMNTAEQAFLHSSSQLQGYLSPLVNGVYEKFAPVMFQPPGLPEVSNIQSYVNVVNPSATTGINVTYEFYDENGCLVTAGGAGFPFTTFIPPEGNFMIPASVLFNDLPQAICGTSCTGGALPVAPVGQGMVRVTADGPFVGGTLHHNYAFETIVDPDQGRPGASSMQPLQAAQTDKTTLYLGPIPISNQAGSDFFNGILPYYSVVNPNNACNTINILIFTRSGLILTNTNVTLQPYGSMVDMSLWAQADAQYAAGNIDDDVIIRVNSVSNLPLIGEGIMVDLYSDDAGKYDRHRMGSVAMANTLADELVNPDFIAPANGVNQETLMAIANFSGQDIAPVKIQYFNRNGNNIATFTINNFPSRSVQRIGPGLANYPSGTFRGWVRIQSCKAGMVGWVMRPIEGFDDFTIPTYRKVYGEALHGGNGLEPGNGFPVSGMQTKVAIMDFVDPFTDSVPGYTAYVNDSRDNIGAHALRFFDPSGTSWTNTAPAPNFAGLQWGRTAFTYEDAVPDWTTGFFTPGMVNGRVDITKGSVKGVDVIGGHLYDANINFSEWFGWGFPPPPTGGTYTGPGDTVPSF